MTPAEIFYKALDGIIAQGDICSSSGGCVYAGPDGTACAIGQLIDRETAEYWDTFETDICSLESDAEEKGLSVEIPEFIQENLDLCDTIQTAHDSAKDLQECVKNFEEVRLQFNIPQRPIGAPA